MPSFRQSRAEKTMKRCIASALLCLAVLLSAFSLAVSAENNVDTPIADIGIYADETVQVGSNFTVEIYVENITAANGVIGNDLPLSYDRDRLTIRSVDCVFPAAWGDNGLFLGKTAFDEYPYYLRSLPDVDDAVENSAYWVKESKQLGYKVTFSADKTGEAFVAVENDPAGRDLIFLVTGVETDNYTANGARININITNEPVESKPDESSVAEGSVAESSAEESSAAESSETSSEEPSGSEDSAESSEESAESSTSADDSTLDEASSADESAEVSVGTASSESSVESRDAENDGGKNGPKPAVIIAVVAVAVVAIALALVFAFMAKKKKQQS